MRICKIKYSLKESKGRNQEFGQRCSESFARYNHDSSLWKTPQCSLVEGLDVFSETWPRSGTMRNGTCSERTTLAPPTKEIGSGSWPTPRASISGMSSKTGGKSVEKSTHLSTQVAIREGMIDMKTGNLKRFPTPRAFMHKDSQRDRGKMNLGEVVGGQLNPDWTEWLMGWPIGWTDLKPLEMVKFQKWLN